MLYQLSNQANWELAITWILDKPIDSRYTYSLWQVHFVNERTKIIKYDIPYCTICSSECITEFSQFPFFNNIGINSSRQLFQWFYQMQIRVFISLNWALTNYYLRPVMILDCIFFISPRICINWLAWDKHKCLKKLQLQTFFFCHTSHKIICN